MKLNNREEVSNSGSKKIPPKNGRKKRVIMESENPISFNNSMVEASPAVKISRSDLPRTLALVSPISNLSMTEPIGLVREARESVKWRKGSATVWNWPSK